MIDPYLDVKLLYNGLSHLGEEVKAVYSLPPFGEELKRVTP